ncbi:hypothetical protein [Spirosoma endophyticum]|uniref:hypothetical protein n=1 Tax=Spirosoma endophyticum TaxID=662367 RepID=UPI0011602F0B|nr:hypothetical protein [Spirosoma endophyticum]
MTTEPRSTDAIEPDLVSALREVIDGLVNPDNHYVVSANYYDHQTPERFGERCGAARAVHCLNLAGPRSAQCRHNIPCRAD